MTNRIEEILDSKDECNQIDMEFDIFPRCNDLIL